MIIRQEIHCHSCRHWVQFRIDDSLDGNHVLNCPNCGHKHYRVVHRGEITGVRWNSSQPTYVINTASSTLNPVYVGTQSISLNTYNTTTPTGQQGQMSARQGFLSGLWMGSSS